MERSPAEMMEGMSLIDVSSEDDALILIADAADKPGEFGHILERVDFISSRNAMEHAPNVSESPEWKQVKIPELKQTKTPELKQAKTEKEKVNLRKSLAWDKAFFSSEGVLNVEELGIINNTFRRVAESNSPTTISEDSRSSIESAATSKSENRALATLEVDLFENLRQSIHSSHAYHNEASTIVQPARTVQQMVPNATGARTSSNVNRPQNKIKSPTVLKRPSINKKLQQDKELPINPTVVANPQGESIPSLKPPRYASKTTSLPSVPRKKDPDYGNTGVKNNAGTTPAGIVAKRPPVSSSKDHGINTVSGIPRSSTLQNASSLSKGKAVAIRGSISYQNFTCGPFHSGSMPSREATRKKVDSRNIKAGAQGSLRGSVSKAPPKAVRAQPASTSSCNSSPSRNFVAWSSSASPASSIDSVTSGTSSMSSGYKSSVFFEASNAGLAASSPPFPLPESQKSASLQPDVRKDCHALSRPHAIEISPQDQSSTGDDARGMMKRPSGLRMPTPNSGYFKAKMTAQNSSKSPRFGGDTNLLRVSGNNTDGGAQRLSLSKSEPAKSPSAGHCSPHTSSENGPIDHLNKGDGSFTSSTPPINQISNVSVPVVAKEDNSANKCTSQLRKEDQKEGCIQTHLIPIANSKYLEKENLTPVDRSGGFDEHSNMKSCSPTIEYIEERISSLDLH